MKLRKYIKRLIVFVRKNYLLSAFILIVGLVGLFIAYKSLSAKPHEIYVKIKVSQGLWWASTARPTQWYIDALRKGDVETDSGKKVAEILSIRYYPSFVPDQFDVYLTMLVSTTYNEKSNKYFFKRSPLMVTSPVDFEFPSVAVSGTVIAMSNMPFEETYVDKTVTLTKNYANPSEYNEIKVGDSYFDGEDSVLKIVKKEAVDSVYSIRDSGINFTGRTETRKDVTLTVTMKVRETDGRFYFGKEQIVRPGKVFYGATEGLTFTEYVIRKIE